MEWTLSRLPIDAGIKEAYTENPSPRSKYSGLPYTVHISQTRSMEAACAAPD